LNLSIILHILGHASGVHALQDFNSSFPLIVQGKNRKLQGLAAAILKLWEKSLIVKIALKWGIPNTNNEQMAYELKASWM
jgi:hypothetical protein